VCTPCRAQEEFLTALSALEKGSQEIKTRFLMSVYDLDGDGQISRNDLGQMFLSSSMLEADQTMRDVVTAFVDTQFQMLQANKTITTEHITDFMKANPQKYEDGAWHSVHLDLFSPLS
jgi:hypothetical protein